jgi:acyl-coenzyme A synthetase/AMP-(fatty) acid ligase
LPNEIEGILNSHSDVNECAEDGVQDIEKGEKVFAGVMKRTASISNKSFPIDFCKE